MEYGLCCLFHNEDIKFKSYTFKGITNLIEKDSRNAAAEKISDIIAHNINSLQKAINYCEDNNIGSYRVSSTLIPQFDRMNEMGLLDIESIEEHLKTIKSNIVLSMHPGQHVNMGSPTESVIENSLKDLKMHFFIAKNIGCSEINIHLGGAYGDKESAKKRFIYNMKKHLTPKELNMITIENDELSYDINDCIEVATELGIRVTYDIHHQRCYELKSESSCEETNFLNARKTWNGYNYQRVHLSSPKDGYTTPSKSRAHHDYINESDYPEWLDKYINVHADIEAKHKESAIFDLRNKKCL